MMEEIKIYLYKPFNKFSEKEDHLEWLKNYFKQKVWFTPSEKFNDPYEGAFYFDNERDIQQINAGNEEFFKFLYETKKDTFTEDEFRNFITNRDFQEKLIKSDKQILMNFFKDIGVLCLCKNPDNVLMWTHYADSLKGYVLEFTINTLQLKDLMIQNTPKLKELGLTDEEISLEIEDFISALFEGHPTPQPLSFYLDDFHFYFLKIQYQSEINKISMFDKFNKGKSFEEFFYCQTLGRKQLDWHYENEFRLIVNTNSHRSKHCDLRRYAPFIKVTGIILGCKMEKEFKDIILELVKENNITPYETTLSDIEYKVKIKPLE